MRRYWTAPRLRKSHGQDHDQDCQNGRRGRARPPEQKTSQHGSRQLGAQGAAQSSGAMCTAQQA
jgi:hypothetical protein